MNEITLITETNSGLNRFEIPVKVPRLSPEALFRLSTLKAACCPSFSGLNDPEFSSKLREMVLSDSVDETSVYISFLWFKNIRNIRFADVPEMLKEHNLRPSTLTEALSLSIDISLPPKSELHEIYERYFINTSQFFYILGSSYLCSVKNEELSFGRSMVDVVNSNSKLLTSKRYWILVTHL